MNDVQTARLRDKVEPTIHSDLDNAKDVKECIAMLRSAGLKDTADRLAHLKSLADDDPDSEPLGMDSVRGAARFLAGDLPLADPEITASDDGQVYLSWWFGKKGVFDMRFLPSGMVAFTAILRGPGSEGCSVNGIMTPSDAVDAARPVYEKMWHS